MIKKFLIPILELLLSIIAIISSFVRYFDFKLLLGGIILLFLSSMSIHENNFHSKKNIDNNIDSLNEKIDNKAFSTVQYVIAIILLIGFILYYITHKKLFAIITVFFGLSLNFVFILEIILGIISCNKL